MKQWLPTLMLVLVCAAGIWYAAANDFFVTSEEEAKGVNELVALTNENIEKITIKSLDYDIDLALADGTWVLNDKADLRLNSSNIDGWINALMLMVYSEVIDTNPSNLAEFGLEQPNARYEVRRKGKKNVVVEVGNELPISGSKYVKVNDSKAIYKVSTADLDLLNKGEIDFIEKNPIVVNYESTRRIQGSWQGSSFDLKMTANGDTEEQKKWSLNGKKDYTHDEAKQLLTDFVSWSTTIATKPIREFDTSVPDFKLSLTEGTGNKNEVREYIGMIGVEDVWIVEKGSKWAYSIPMETVNALMVTMNKNK